MIAYCPEDFTAQYILIDDPGHLPALIAER